MASEAGKLWQNSASKISPSKSRLVARAVSAARARELQPFTQGEDLKGEEGSLTRMSSRILLSDLVAEHNRGGEHLELHQPVCLEHQFKAGVVFGCYSTPMMLLHIPRAVNSQWPLLAGFDSTFGISSNKFEMLGMNFNSLYDSTLEFPAAYSKQVLPSNAKSKRPSAWAEVLEEEEGPSRTERWTMQQR
jgi:hypothetical protein